MSHRQAQSPAANYSLCFIGVTGDGKSAASNLFHSVLGGRQQAFCESDKAFSQTQHPQIEVVGGVKLIDTPGLLDTSGACKDIKNVGLIVDTLKAQKAVNSFILVLNSSRFRFDAAMQDACKLMSDSFGTEMWNHCALLWTHSSMSNETQLKKNQQRSLEVWKILQKRIGLTLPQLPTFQIDCHPEELADLGTPDEFIDTVRKATHSQTQALLRWARHCPPMDTSCAIIGEYEAQKARRLARELAAREEAARVAAARAAAAEAARQEAIRRETEMARQRAREEEEARERRRREAEEQERKERERADKAERERKEAEERRERAEREARRRAMDDDDDFAIEIGPGLMLGGLGRRGMMIGGPMFLGGGHMIGGMPMLVGGGRRGVLLGGHPMLGGIMFG